MERQLTYAQAINEALALSMAADPSVFLMGLGVPDPKGVFGTTLGLQDKYGAKRVMDMPCAEGAMTGITIGAALVGMRPVITHQRVDFALLAVEQLVNQAAKWHYMFGGQMKVPLVVRLLIGRGWGQGPQHSQSLQSWFAHVPGLKVVMPVTPSDAKGLMTAAIEDNNPVVVLEHRWLHTISGPVPEGMHREPLGKCRVVQEGKDVTFVGMSYTTLEAIRAAGLLAKEGIDAEVIDVRTIRPLDIETIRASVRKTGRLIVADAAESMCGVAGEIMAGVVETEMRHLKEAPCRLTLPDSPTPTSPPLSALYYPRHVDLMAAARRVLGRPASTVSTEVAGMPLDVPDRNFKGPF